MVAEEGQTVNANQSAPTIVKVAKLDVMTVKAQISEADVTRVKPGMPTYFTILGEPDVKHPATLRAVEPAPVSYAESSSGTSSSTSSSSTSTAVYYNGLCDAPNPDGTLRWRYGDAAAAEWSPVALGEDGTVYVTTDDGVVAIGADGRKKWAFALQGRDARGPQHVLLVDIGKLDHERPFRRGYTVSRARARSSCVSISVQARFSANRACTGWSLPACSTHSS